jgi:hypothetical protein
MPGDPVHGSRHPANAGEDPKSAPWAWLAPGRDAEGVLITGVYGSGKNSVAAEITYLLEQRDQPYALLDLDCLGWVGDHAIGYRMMLRNLAAVSPDYLEAGIGVFVVAYFVRDLDALRSVREALGVPLRAVRLSVSINNDRPLGIVAREVMAWLGWL